MDSDAELWERARGGDEVARARVGALAVEIAAAEYARRGVGGATVEDLVQESARSTLAYLARGGEGPRDLRAFLKYRAWGVLSDHRKRMRTALPTADLALAPEPADSGRGPQAAAALRQLARALRDCRERLAPEQRETLALRYEGRLEGEAVAARLGVHRNTVHVRVFRALGQLRECLARKGFAAEDLEP